MSHDTEQPPLSPLAKISVYQDRALWEARVLNDGLSSLRIAATRARQALADNLPLIAAGILDAAIDESWTVVGQVAE